jgi:hypothetical protein
LKNQILSIALISVLGLSAIQLISPNFASATATGAVFCPNYYYGGIDTANEISLSRTICTYIKNTLDARLSGGCSGWFDAGCSIGTYRTVLANLRYTDQAIVFTKGHRGMPYFSSNPPNTNHYSLLDYNGYDLKDHNDIYDRTGSHNAVSFIWHCETSLHYAGDGTIPQDAYGCYGMPYCWTHNANMPMYTGTTGSQVYLGWNNSVPGVPYPQQAGGSPQFEYEIDAEDDYSNVAAAFWYYMSLYDNNNIPYSVADSLDLMCNGIYLTDFSNTDLDGWLIVYGNSNLGLP